MADRKPLVLVAGQVQEMPAGDSISGADLLHPATNGGLRDVTTSVGTGTLTLDTTPPAGYADLGTTYTDGQSVDYCIQGTSGEWEVGTGTLVVTGSSTIDPYWASTTLLLRGEGVNNGTTFSDSSTSANAITRYGSAVTSTAQAKYGTASIKLNGTTDYISSPHNVGSTFGSGNFTVEGWVYPTNLAGVPCFYVQQSNTVADNNNIGVFSYITAAGEFSADIRSGLTVYTAISPAGAVVTNAWQHLAIVRNGTTLKCYVNGVERGSVAVAATAVNNPGDVPRCLVGVYSYGGLNNLFTGYIDDLRVTKGVARYTGNFTPAITQIGTVVAGAQSISRGLVRASSNGGALVNFSAGTKQVFALPYARSARSGALGRQYANSRAFALP